MFRSLQWRLTFWFMLIIVIGIGALGAFLTLSVRNSHLETLRSDLESEALIIAGNSRSYLVSSAGLDDLEALFLELGKDTKTRFTIIRLDGTVLADSHEDPAVMGNHATRPEIIDALANGYGESTRYSITIDERLMYVAVPIMNEGETIGVARVALPVTRVDTYVNHAITSLILATAISAAVVMLAAWLITRVITRPIRDLTTASRQLAAGDFDTTIPPGATDESGELARAFAEMAARLKDIINALSADKTQLSAIIDNMADGLITTDAEGTVTLINRTAVKLLGIGSPAGEGRPLIQTVRDYELTDIFQRCLASHQPEEVQFEASASGRYLRAIAVQITSERQGGVLILIQDLTELRTLQTMRRDIVGNISHDFRTPLAGIKAMVDTLVDGALNEPAAARDFLTRIDGEVSILTQMVAELTELSRIETGRTELQLAPTDLNEIIREGIEHITPQAERQNVKLVADLEPDLPLVNADADRIRQVIINLLHNAVKFNHPDGSITVATSSGEKNVAVSITDTGIGIAQADIDRIFERFYKADKSRTGSGSGMGLAIAKHIVEAHGGTITTASTEGQGATFTFRLPR